MKVGYCRVSTNYQDEALQRDALIKAGCDPEHIFMDKISGSKFEREGLNEAIKFLRSGDTLVVWKLDRAGRSIKHLIGLLETLSAKGVDFISLTESIDTTTPVGKLIFHVIAAIAEFERDLNKERTFAGLEAARARGRKGGRPRKIKNGGRIARIKQEYGDGVDIPELCESYSISKSTLYRYLKYSNQSEKKNEVS